MVNKSKCKGINMGKQVIQMKSNNQAYNKIMEIVNKNNILLEETINGSYRFGCI